MATKNRKFHYLLFSLLALALGVNMSWLATTPQVTDYATTDPDAKEEDKKDITVTSRDKGTTESVKKGVPILHNGKVEIYDIKFSKKEGQFEATLQATSDQCSELCDKTFTLEGMTLGEGNTEAVRSIVEAIAKEEEKSKTTARVKATDEAKEVEEITESTVCSRRSGPARISCNANHLIAMSRKLGESDDDKYQLQDYYKEFLEGPLQNLLDGGDRDRDNSVDIIGRLQERLKQSNSNSIKVSISKSLRESFAKDARDVSRTYEQAQGHATRLKLYSDAASMAEDFHTKELYLGLARMEHKGYLIYSHNSEEQFRTLRDRLGQTHGHLNLTLRSALSDGSFTNSDLFNFYTRPFHTPTSSLLTALYGNRLAGLGGGNLDSLLAGSSPSVFSAEWAAQRMAAQQRRHGDPIIRDYTTTQPSVPGAFPGARIPAPSVRPQQTNTNMPSNIDLSSRIREGLIRGQQ